ncbi:DUF1127 domain-containing protein [Rhizobium sp. Root1203]|uniref:DUF1127 domain-containing protein n=1 Tax=Rhizobium sp. Root1203 TaxID=1736427 RepID=UPI0009E8381E
MTTDTSRNGHNALENRLSRSPSLRFKAVARTLAIAADGISRTLIGTSRTLLGISRTLLGISRTLLGISEKRRSRQALSELTDQQLDDIGLTRSEVKAETAKSSFWF